MSVPLDQAFDILDTIYEMDYGVNVFAADKQSSVSLSTFD